MHSNEQVAAPGNSPTHETLDHPSVPLLQEIVQGYRSPAALLSDDGEVVFVNDAALRAMEREPGESDAVNSPKDWPRRAVIAVGAERFHLALPAQAGKRDAQAGKSQLAPRLSKIARLVVAGCTDKQIAAHTGLAFTTVRTYVRQIYKRAGVHSRVELVHATAAHPL
jgi:DNA-binding NarL/FixJ family response regulator